MLLIRGRIAGEDVDLFRPVLDQEVDPRAIDLGNVLLVGREAVKLLAQSEAKGGELRNCPRYVREWVKRAARATEMMWYMCSGVIPSPIFLSIANPDSALDPDMRITQYRHTAWKLNGIFLAATLLYPYRFSCYGRELLSSAYLRNTVCRRTARWFRRGIDLVSR